MKRTKLNIQIEKTFAVILLSGTILLSACSESKDSQNISKSDAYLKQGESSLQMNQFKAAFSAANDAIKVDSARIDGYLLLAEIYQQSGQPLQSVKSLEAFTGIKNSEYYFSLLAAYQKSGKLISAQNLINGQTKTLQEQPQRLQLAQAQQLLYSQKLEQAKSAFEDLLKIENYKIESMLGLAKIEASLNNDKTALNMLDDIIKLDSKNTESLLIKSMIYIKSGDLENAEKSLSEALTKLPTTDVFTTQRVQIIQSLAEVLTRQGHSTEAMIYSQILNDEFPAAESLSLQYNRALKLFENKQFSSAKKILLEILDNNPGDKKSATLLGIIFYQEGNPKSAEQYLENVVDPETSPLKLTQLYIATQLQQKKSDDVLALLDLVPEANRNIDTWVLYANAAIQQKEFSKAKMAIDTAKSLSPQSFRIALTEILYYNSLAEPELALQSASALLAAHPENQKAQLSYLQQLLILNKITEADDYIARLKENYSQNTDSQLIVANYYIYQQKPDQAKQIIEQILAKEPSNQQALYSLVKVNGMQQNWSLVLTNYQNIITFYPSEITAYQGVVRSLMKLQQDPLKAAEHMPSNYEMSVLALTLANLTLQQNRLELAAAYAKDAGNELPQKYQASLDRLLLQLDLANASIAFKENDDLKAKKIVLSALEKAPKDIPLLSLLTRIEIRSKEYEQAKKISEQIGRLLPDSSLSTRLAADIFNAQGKPQQAINLLTSYWQNTKDEEVATQLYLQLRDDNLEEALTFLDNWQKTLPESRIAMRYKAIALQNTGNKEQALILYEAQLKKTPNDVISLNNAAWLYFEQGNPIAISLAQKAYQLMPNNGAVLDTYGWILYKNGELQQGKELIEKAVLLSPDDNDIKAHLLEINNK
ncbi:MAG: tetratricopeptide (TPR) repeat protein [Psychromonas sp.]|jgi:tetratricopeptide (TPR) repeat protein|uniref:hypothetical protein n=1 Tax=Psychromonas sp. TaxID=1884585 RepID=UPI0039E40840